LSYLFFHKAIINSDQWQVAVSRKDTINYNVLEIEKLFFNDINNYKQKELALNYNETLLSDKFKLL